MSGYKQIKSVRLALDLLELAGTCPNGLSLSEMATGMRLKKQTLYNILGTLTDKGFLVRQGDRPRYALGGCMKALRNKQGLRNRALLPAGIRIASRTAKRTGSTVSICQCIGETVIARVRGYCEPDSPPSVWYHYPMFPHGSAILFEAYMSQSERRTYRRRYPFSEEDADYWQSYELLDELLEQVRKTGYVAFSKGKDFRAAAAVFGPDSALEASVTLAKPSSQTQPAGHAECLLAVRQAAEELSAVLKNPPATAHSFPPM